ncbi:MAG: SusC/RagA family TonB-linked outer membrane protein [Balneolaceae bacterium]
MNYIKLRKDRTSWTRVWNSLLRGAMSSAGVGFLAFALIAGLGFSDSVAQDRVEVSGTVVDAADGSPLPGASVIVQGSREATGSTIGTQTDFDGQFTLRVPSNLNILVVTFVGFDRQEVPIDGRTNIRIEMQPDFRTLDDIVVVGYGVQDRREITSSVTSVSAEDFNRGNIQDTQQLLQGKVPGLTISRPGGDPNADFTIRMRGLATFGANTEPLVVIDGVIGADFNTVDPNDIATIDVLRDASAAAIYGTRGANGVILVTTKSGTRGADVPVTVNYNGQITTNFIERKLDVLSADQFRAEIQRQGRPGLDFGDNTDWFDEITQNGFTQVHNLAISGGGENTSYRISGNFRDTENIQRGTGFEQVGGRLNLTHRALDNRLQLQGNISITNRDEDRGFGEAFRYAAAFNPTRSVRDPNSNFGGFSEQDAFDMFNPVAIQELAINVADQRRIVASLGADYDFDDLLPGLTLGAFYSVETFDETRGEFYSPDARFRGFGRNGLARRGDVNNETELFEATARYSNTFERIRLESVFGYSFQEFTNESRFIEAGNFITGDVLSFNRLAAAIDVQDGIATVDNFRDENRIIGAFGRVNLTFDNTYFFSASYRREGSTRFGANNRWGDFFAFSGGAELTNIFDIGFADELKPRISFGRTGQDAPFNGISQFLLQPTGNNFLVDGEFIPVFGPVRTPNPDLRWETKEEINIGVDFAVLSGRLTGSIDVYRSDTDDLILEQSVDAATNPAPTQFANVGAIRNEGLDIGVNFNAIQRQNVNWSTGITFSTSDTELRRFQFENAQFIANMGAPGLNDTQLIRVQEGANIGDIWGPRFAKFSEASDGFLDGDGNPLVGAWLFFDKDGNLVRPESITDEDRTVLGNGLPDFTLGWNNTVNYKNWDFNMFWRGAFGHQMVNSFAVFQTNPTVINNRNITEDALGLQGLNEAPQFSSLYVENADFFRLDNLTVGYTFNFLDGGPINRLRLFASGNNLWTITNYSGVDPEVQFADVGPTDNAGDAGAANPLAPGIERRNQWFTQTSITFGVNIDF